MEFEEDEIILGIVEKIESMTVFVKLENGRIGTIIISEIAPGRIKNLREYVAPNKIIVCKVLRDNNERLDLSLRRVTAKEKQEKLAEYKREKDIEMGLKSILKERYPEFKENIKKEFVTLSRFIEAVRLDKEILKKYIPKNASPEDLSKVEKLTEEKKREIEIKKLVKLKCFDSDGLSRIKEVFNDKNETFKITYISAGNYLITLKAEDYKKANSLMQDFLDALEKKSKKISCDFSVEDKK